MQYQQNTKYTNHLADHHSGCILGLKAAGNYLYIIDLKDSNSDKYDRVSNLASIRRDIHCKKKREKETSWRWIQFYDKSRECRFQGIYIEGYIVIYANIQKYLKINYIVKKKYIYILRFYCCKVGTETSTRTDSVLVITLYSPCSCTRVFAIKLPLSSCNNDIRFRIAK